MSYSTGPQLAVDGNMELVHQDSEATLRTMFSLSDVWRVYG